MRVRYATITLALTSLLPLASSFAADTKLVKAVSDHFELYTTDNEAAATAALTHFETVRGYLLKVTGGQDPFAAPVRIVGFKTPGEFNSHMPAGVTATKAFSEANAERVTIALASLKPEMYQYGAREYVTLLLNRTNPKMPYWLRLGLSELYCTLRLDNGHLVVGTAPTREFHSQTLHIVCILSKRNPRTCGRSLRSRKEASRTRGRRISTRRRRIPRSKARTPWAALRPP